MSPFYEDRPIIRRFIGEEERKYVVPTTSSRTQHKLQLQRLFVLTNDKNYLDHPKNMRRLTKELDRVNREYRCVRRFQDPVQESFRRLGQKARPGDPLNHLFASNQKEGITPALKQSRF
ncbi:hypothetical protein INT48_002175 [Thamnidium elegans]|uniref:Uncharacterized protein n=1 Tax=Thamnidium elegans TaxID=101142 RepID=A0A8H7T0Y4_9FUNG|nr:hypothetical protein INT48_002175 [Thamnidium elegans]